MAIVTKPQYFLGTVVGISKDDNEKLKNTREYHEILVDIPGVIQGVKAFPEMNELDEPKIGDQVLLLSLDPLYNSYFVYRKLKENDFIGFRASGKMIDITPDYITVGVFKEDLVDYPNDAHWDGDKIDNAHITSLTIDNKGTITVEAAKDNGDEGNLEVYLKGSSNIEIHGSDGNTVKIDKDSNVKIDGKSNVEVTGNCTIKCNANVKIEASGNCDITANASCKVKAIGACDISSDSSCTVTSPNTTLKGPGELTISGITESGSSAFCNLPNCIITGVPHSIGTIKTLP
jgi:hypothetical protein